MDESIISNEWMLMISIDIEWIIINDNDIVYNR